MITVSWPDPTDLADRPVTGAIVVLTERTIEPLARTIRLRFAVYRSQEALEAGRSPLDILQYSVGPDQYDQYAAPDSEVEHHIEAQSYAYLRAQLGLPG